MKHKLEEQKAAEEKLRKEAERMQLEKEKQLKIIEEERKRKEEEQRLREEEKKRLEEAERLKQLEAEQKAREIQSATDSSELKHEVQQNNQHKPMNKQQKQTKVKHDEENRLCEQLKLLQQQALKEKENEQNQKVSKDVSIAAQNGVSGSLSQKHMDKLSARRESDIQLHEKMQSEEEIMKQRQLEKVQDEQKLHKTRKNLQVHWNNEGQQKQVKQKEAGKMDEVSWETEEEKMKHKEKDGMNKLLLIQKNKDASVENVTQNKLLVSDECNSPRQVSPKSIVDHAEHEMKSGSSANHTEKTTAKHENSHSALHNEADSSKVACQTLKPDTAKCLVKQPSNDAWEKMVEAKRLKWMHECESWRYVCPLVIFLLFSCLS